MLGGGGKANTCEARKECGVFIWSGQGTGQGQGREAQRDNSCRIGNFTYLLSFIHSWGADAGLRVASVLIPVFLALLSLVRTNRSAAVFSSFMFL